MVESHGAGGVSLRLLSIWFLEGTCPCALLFLSQSHLPGLFNHKEKTTVERVGRTEHSLAVGEGGADSNAPVLQCSCPLGL